MSLFSLTKRFGAALSLLVAVGAAACGGPRAVRGEEVQGLDDQAMSTGLDKRDLDKMLHENMKALQSSAVIQRWQGENRPSVAVLPLRNETSEHIDSALETLISDIETTLVNAGHVSVVDMQAQPELLEQIKKQQSEGFDQAKASAWGKQVGARYIVTGKVFSTDERQDDERRVQYSMFIQVLSVETGEILFQYKTNVTKAVI
jgi:penicillin-binding protein activator